VTHHPLTVPHHRADGCDTVPSGSEVNALKKPFMSLNDMKGSFRASGFLVGAGFREAGDAWGLRCLGHRFRGR